MEVIEVKGEQYFVDALSEDNLSDLIDLFKEVFGVEHSQETLRKKYNTSYLGHSYFGHFARDENKKAVAFHGAVAYLVTYNGKVELAAQYGDAMTMKAFTGRGFFTLLGKRTDELLKSKGVRFVYGFPNQNSEYGYLNKMGWQYKERMHLFRFRVATLPVSTICHKVRWLHPIYRNWGLRKLKKLKAGEGELVASMDGEPGPNVLHNENFFNYKCYSDNMICDLDGDLVWLKLGSSLLIGDIRLRSDSNAALLIKKNQQTL